MSENTALKTFQFELVSPEKVLASQPATLVVVPGEDGEFGVMQGHTRMISSLRPGVVRVTGEAGETKIFVSGGFADVSGSLLSILAEEAVPVADMNVDTLSKQLANLKDDLAVAAGDVQKTSRLERQIVIVEAKLKAVG